MSSLPFLGAAAPFALAGGATACGRVLAGAGTAGGAERYEPLVGEPSEGDTLGGCWLDGCVALRFGSEPRPGGGGGLLAGGGDGAGEAGAKSARIDPDAGGADGCRPDAGGADGKPESLPRA
jgi:hypothetical protein